MTNRLKEKQERSKEKQIQVLSECIQVEAHAECMKCENTIGGMFLDEDELAEDMYEQGWQFKYNILYCPNCVKKYLKK